MNKNKLTYRYIFFFWIPLAATWLMMSLEGPFIAAVIARMLEPKYNLAAYGVAFSFAIIVEAPIIMLMSAATALVKDKNSYTKLKNFTHVMNFLITLAMLILIVPSVFYYITVDLMGLPRNVAHLTHIASIILIPWPAAIGYRRFYQGVLIRYNLTKRVAYGTVVRLVCMSLTALYSYFFLDLPGAYAGAIALSMGVTFESLSVYIMTKSTVKKIMNEKSENENKGHLTYHFIINFYYPLAISTILILGVRPMVTFFMGRSPFPVESLAVLPVVGALTFIFRCFGVSFQEAGIALIGDNHEGYDALKNFASVLGIGLVFALSVIAFTPLSKVWFHNISGLSLELTFFSLIPLKFMVLIPGLAVLQSLQRSVLVNRKKTAPVTIGTAIEAGGIVLTLLIAVNYTDLSGASAACIAFSAGSLLATIYLFFPFWDILREVEKSNIKEVGKLAVNST